MDLISLGELADKVGEASEVIEGAASIADKVSKGFSKFLKKDDPAIAHAQRGMIDLMEKLMAAQRLQIQIERSLHDMQSAAQALDRFEEMLARYATVTLPGGGIVLQLKPEHVDTETPHSICPACAGNRKKQFLQPAGALLRCPGCSTSYRQEKVATGAMSVPIRRRDDY